MKELKTISKENLNNILKTGGVIAFVTDTVWGIGCLPDCEKAVKKIYEIKGRDESKPLILMSNEAKYLYPYVKEVPDLAKKYIAEYFPGALTIVLQKSDLTKDFITSYKNTVGIRVPDNECFKTICSLIEGHVLATTSANISNEPSSKTYDEVCKSIGDLVDIVIKDEGYTCEGKESTVILVDSESCKILRQGAINF